MKTAQANAQAACALVEALARGAKHAVISPGSRNTPIALALHAAESIETHVVLDERTGGFLALGLARASGTPVILSCTSGSAGAHYLPAVIEAYEAMTPLIIITADRPPELHGHAAPQTTRQDQLYAQHVAARYELPLPDVAPHSEFQKLGIRALSTAIERPGPVHLNAPFREPLWDRTATYTVSAPTDAVRATPVSSPDLLEDLKQAVAGTPRGLLIVGARSCQDGLSSETEFGIQCHRIARSLQWPILTDITSGARFAATDSPLHITGFDTLLRDPRFADELPDKILLLGRPPTSKALNRWLSQNQVPAVVLGHHPEHRDPELKVELALPCDPSSVLCDWTYEQPGDPKWLSRWADGERVFRDALLRMEGDWEGAIAYTVVHGMPEGGLLHLASSMPIRDADGFTGPLKKHVSVVSNRGVNGIDGLIATAAGQALAWASGPVALLIGDLAFLHDLGSLRDAVTRNTSLCIVLVNNGGGHIFDFLPISDHRDTFERYFLTPQSADMGALVSATGARHRAVDSTDALRGAIQEASHRPGVCVVEFRTEGTKNRQLHEAFYDHVHRELR